MSVKESKEGLCISGDRKVPATTATQFCDNSQKPFWSFKDSISASDDFFDCYVSFKDLNFHEYFWDWKGRKLDELLFQKLVSAYKMFFSHNEIGKKFFLTLRVGNVSDLEVLGRVYMSIISSSNFASSQKMFSPPLFEVVHSAKSPGDMMRFANLYSETVGMATDKLQFDCNPKLVSFIPEHDFNDSANWYSSLHQYLDNFQSSFRCKAHYLRPLINRAGIADELGFIGSVLATKKALSSYASFSSITGMSVYPVIETGTTMFRGGLNPDTLKNFIDTYPGVRTVGITSAFRYDYNVRSVKESVALLNSAIPRSKAESYTKEQMSRLGALTKIFAKNYKRSLSALPKMDELCKSLRSVNKSADASLERSFSLYSLGVPPELLGAGSSIIECIKEGLVKDLEQFYPNIKSDLLIAGRFLNKENLNFLSKMDKGWKSVLSDVKLVEDYVDSSLGPDSAESFMHRNHTSNVFHLWSNKRDFSLDIAAAARLRHSLG